MLREQRARAAVDKIIDDLETNGDRLLDDGRWWEMSDEAEEILRETWAKIIVEFMA